MCCIFQHAGIHKKNVANARSMSGEGFSEWTTWVFHRHVGIAIIIFSDSESQVEIAGLICLCGQNEMTNAPSDVFLTPSEFFGLWS